MYRQKPRIFRFFREGEENQGEKKKETGVGKTFKL